MSDVLIVIMFIIGCLFCLFLTCLVYECFRYMKNLNEKSEANKLNNNKTQSELEAQTRKNCTSKKADTE